MPTEDGPLRKSKRQLMELCDHEKEISNDKEAMRLYEEVSTVLLTFYPISALPSRSVLFSLYCRNTINSMPIVDRDDFQPIGVGLYLDLAAYDYSCRPNATHIFDGTVAILRPLDPDIDVTDPAVTRIIYCDLSSSKQWRQEFLRSWF